MRHRIIWKWKILVLNEFKGEAQVAHYNYSPFGKGLSLVIKGIKTDILDWARPFHSPPESMEGIQMACRQEIALMKLNILTSPLEFIRYEKKGFVDLAFLIEELRISGLIELFRKFNPDKALPDRIILEALQASELADKKPFPKMLQPLTWAENNIRIQEAIRQYLSL